MVKKKQKRKTETALMFINREMAKNITWNSQPGTLHNGTSLFVLTR